MPDTTSGAIAFSMAPFAVVLALKAEIYAYIFLTTSMKPLSAKGCKRRA